MSATFLTVALPFPVSSNGGASAMTLADPNGNTFSNANSEGVTSLTATGTAAGSLSAAFGKYVYAGASTATYKLPAESNAANLTLRVVNASSANVLTIAPFGAETINGATNSVSVGTGYATASFFNDPTSGVAGWIKV